MKAFLQRFGALVAGILQGFDRLVFKGKLRHLYGPEGMHAFFGINRIPRENFKTYAAETTKQILEASLVAEAKKLQRYRYLNSSSTDKEQTARQIAAEQRVQQGLVCVLQCAQPCWTFDTFKDRKGTPIIRGERGKCSHLYHYFIHPKFGWMYVRLQTWFPFEIQVASMVGNGCPSKWTRTNYSTFEVTTSFWTWPIGSALSNCLTSNCRRIG
jgi:hypothetical protein